MHTVVDCQLTYIIFLLMHYLILGRCLLDRWLDFFALGLKSGIRSHSMGHFGQRLWLLICWSQDGIRLDLLIHRHTIGITHICPQFPHNLLRIFCWLLMQNGPDMLLLIGSFSLGVNLSCIFAIKCLSTGHIIILHRSTVLLQIFGLQMSEQGWIDIWSLVLRHGLDYFLL